MRDEMTKWTEGPWEAFESTIRPGVWYVGTPHVALLRTDSSSHPEADARLSAAAPDLYEALARCEEMVSTDKGPPDWDAIRALLARAQGASNVG